VVLKHEKGWIRSQGVKDSIHASHKNNCEQQTMFINKIWNGGYKTSSGLNSTNFQN